MSVLLKCTWSTLDESFSPLEDMPTEALKSKYMRQTLGHTSTSA
jgi:hypothetical protein